MRYDATHKDKTHQKIVEQASQEFRKHGFEGVGISKLMAKLGLTHGGFYAHFQDKEDLKDQAMEFALDHSYEMAVDSIQRGGILAYIDHYTSDLHRDHPEFGCALATLAAEEGRRSPESRAKFATRYQGIIDLIAEELPSQTLQEKQDQAHFVMSTLSGSVAVARATGDPNLAKTILRAARERLTDYIKNL